MGPYTNRIPGGRPSLPSDSSIENLFAVGTGGADPSKIRWFLCKSNAEFNEWMTQFKSTVPSAPTDAISNQPTAPKSSEQPSASRNYYRKLDITMYLQYTVYHIIQLSYEILIFSCFSFARPAIKLCSTTVLSAAISAIAELWYLQHIIQLSFVMENL